MSSRRQIHSLAATGCSTSLQGNSTCVITSCSHLRMHDLPTTQHYVRPTATFFRGNKNKTIVLVTNETINQPNNVTQIN